MLREAGAGIRSRKGIVKAIDELTPAERRPDERLISGSAGIAVRIHHRITFRNQPYLAHRQL
jgi:hypothetical protein